MASLPKSFIPFFFIITLSSSQPLSTSIYLSDWGFESIGAIRMGQCSIIRYENGSELKVESLYDEKAFTSNSAAPSSVLQVTDCNGQFINQLGGSSAVYAGNGATASANHAISVGRVEAVTIDYDKGEKGFCGYWMHLFNSAAPAGYRRYLNAASFKYLIFAIRSVSGTERVNLKIADERLNGKEDAAVVGDCGQWLPAGRITTGWQLARVPLSALPLSLDKRGLASIVFEAVSPLKGTFEIGPVWFSRRAESVSLPLRQDSVSDSPLHRALWVWDTKDIVQNNGEDSLLHVLKQGKFDNVFLALPYDPLTSPGESGVTVDTTLLTPLLKALNSAGIKVHALIGDKDFILPGKVEFVRNTIQNLVRYNSSAPIDCRFFAIHLDVEPYLVPGFNSPARNWYLRNFIGIMNECAEIAHKGGLQIGADVPPWYDNADELTHGYMEIQGEGGPVRLDTYTVISETNTVPLYKKLIDIFDEITLMDYRTEVDGDNGTVMFAIKELEYAEEKGKEIFVGLETHALPDETIVTLREPMTKGIPSKAPVIVAAPRNEYKTDFTYIANELELDEWLKMKKDTGGMYYWPVVRTTDISSTSFTFAGLGMRKLEEALQKAEPAFRRYRSFAGYAIHEYRSYTKMK